MDMRISSNVFDKSSIFSDTPANSKTGALFSKPVLVSSALSVSTLSISVSNGFELSCSSFLFGFSCSFDVLALPSSTFSDFFVSVILGSSAFDGATGSVTTFSKGLSVSSISWNESDAPCISANGSVPLFISPNGSLPSNPPKSISLCNNSSIFFLFSVLIIVSSLNFCCLFTYVSLSRNSSRLLFKRV